MNAFSERIAKEFPVRQKKTEKERFRSFLVYRLKEMGYTPQLQHGQGGVTNVVAGDPEKAKLLFAAHYGTGRREVLPLFYSPTRPVTFLLYQAITPLAVLLASFALALLICMPLSLPGLMLPLFLLLLIAALLYLRFGPAEKNNRNDPDAAIAALLTLAEKLSPRYRGEIAFLFLDGEAQHPLGARCFRKAYPVARETPALYLDAVGKGDELLILPNKRCRWNGELLDAILSGFDAVSKRRTCFLKTDGLVCYPSGNRIFKNSVVFCACRKLNGFGRYIAPKSREAAEEENLAALAEGLLQTVACYSPK